MKTEDKIKVGVLFRNTDKTLEFICVNNFGSLEEYWNDDEMLYEREYNVWKIGHVDTEDRTFTARRLIPEHRTRSEADHYDAVNFELFDDGYIEIIK